MAFDIGIAIHNPLDVYTCGDTIKGAVYLKSDRGVPVERLLVQLLCRVTVRGKGKETWPGVSRLGEQQTVSIPYCFVKRLVSRPRSISSDQPLEFNFKIPSESKRNRIEPRWLPGSIFEEFAGYALPPTWEDRFERAEVRHSLEVVMNAGEGYGGSQFTAARDITFSPCRAVEFPDARCIATNRCLLVKVPKSMIHGERFKKKRSLVQLLTPEEKHPMYLQLSANFPTVLYSGGPIPMCVKAASDQLSRAQRQATSPGDAPPPYSADTTPVIIVDGLYAYLTVRTHRRIKLETGLEHILFEDDQIPVCNIIDRPIAVNDSPVPLNIHYPEMRLNPDTTPSFNSFNARRNFELHVRIRVLIGDSYHNVDLSSSVAVLPGVYRNTAGAVRDIGGSRTSLRRRLSEETLPPYAEHDPLAVGPTPLTWERPPPLVA